MSVMRVFAYSQSKSGSYIHFALSSFPPYSVRSFHQTGAISCWVSENSIERYPKSQQTKVQPQEDQSMENVNRVAHETRPTGLTRSSHRLATRQEEMARERYVQSILEKTRRC